ncbi:serine/threonine protein kinase [Streptomyces sp. NPDC057052]|uniref:serine/threonine protein kinase n=1 Tax=Streptomyces sp. NPDC057052 TaxID=3346010 RepID=UPI003644E043
MTFPADPGGPGEDLAPPTLYEPEPAPGGLPAPDPRGDPDTLPPTLAARFVARERLPRRGEQTVHRAGEEGRSAELRAAVFRVLDHRAAGPDTERVLKWFHPDAAPDDEVTALLSEPLHDGLSYVLERGTANGAPFHVLPSHGSTDFATFLRDRGKLSSEEIRGLVGRLHGALTALHAAGVVHRDVKPSNLVLGDYARPTEDLVLIDFGISLVARSPREASGAWAATPRYASPQALLRKPIVRAADDWWSLGVLVAEAARGRHPVERHHEPASVMDAVQAGALDLGGITDERVRLLCKGLLAHHPEDRWGSAQVAEWLAGRSPRVVSRPGPAPRTADGTADGTADRPAAGAGPAPDVPRFEHAGRTFTDPARLGEEFDADWPAMVRRLARGRERERLGRWLGEFRPERDPVRAEALDDLLREGLRRRPDAGTLIDLIGWMAPQQEPGYRGIPLGVGDLPAFAGRAAAGDRQCVDVMGELHRHRLLGRLAARRGGEELAHVDQRWQDHHDQWDAAVARLSEIPEVGDDRDGLRAATGTGPALTAELLHLAAAPAPATRRLRADLERAVRGLPAHVSWFVRLAEDAREPVPLLLALRLHPLALEQARAIRREREHNRQLAATDAASRHFRLVQRRLELPVMLGRAAGGALLLFFPHAFVVGLADVTGRAPQPTVLTAWLLSVPSLAALLAVECWTAWYIGPRYHPDHSVMGLLTRRSLPVTRRITRRGWRGRLWAGLALAAVAGTVLGTFLLAVWIWPAATVLALLVSSVLRVRAWNARLAAARGAGRPLTGAAGAGGGTGGAGGTDGAGGGGTVPGARRPLRSPGPGAPSGAGMPSEPGPPPGPGSLSGPGTPSDPRTGPRTGSPAGARTGPPAGTPSGSASGSASGSGSPSGGVA